MAEETITRDHLAADVRNLGDLERAMNFVETDEFAELKSFAAVTLDQPGGKKATQATYKFFTFPTKLKFGRLECLQLPHGMNLDQFKVQQAGRNLVFVCTGRAVVNDAAIDLVAFRPKPAA